MPLRTCIVSYRDMDCTYSVEVLAESLYEAVVLGVTAMKMPSDRLYLQTIEVLVKPPEVYRSVTGASLRAWLSRPGKTEKEAALKKRLGELLRG